jgi:hypothetical protein
VIFAEGLPTETFVDDNSRILFDNADEYGELYGASPAAPPPSGWRLEQGATLEAIRQQVAHRAGTEFASPGHGPLRGHVERITDSVVEGWVVDEADPMVPVELELRRNGRTVLTFLANRYRADLDHHDIGIDTSALPGGHSLAMPQSEPITA